MTDEIEPYEKTIVQNKKALDEALQEVAPLRGKPRQESIKRMEQLALQIQKALSNYRYQLRNLKDPNQRAEWDKKMREHTHDLAYFNAELQKVKDSKVPVDGEDGDGTGGITIDMHDEQTRKMSTASVQREALRIADKSIAAVNRTLQMATQTEQLGSAINTQLAQQTETMHRIDEQVDFLEMEITRAQREFMFFVRSAMGDKCFLCLLCLVIVCIVFIVAYTIFGKKK